MGGIGSKTKQLDGLVCTYKNEWAMEEKEKIASRHQHGLEVRHIVILPRWVSIELEHGVVFLWGTSLNRGPSESVDCVLRSRSLFLSGKLVHLTAVYCIVRQAHQ